MARSKNPKSGSRSRVRFLAYGVPLIALAAVALVFTITVLPPPSVPAAMDYTFKLLVEVTNKEGNSTRAIAPPQAIGEAGGSWNVSAPYSSDSVDSSHYPVYMDAPYQACTPVCLIHVKSRIVHTYTLGDFFNVWGQPLSENNTIGIPAKSGFVWEMCIGPDPSTATVSSLWGGQPLQSNIDLTLDFYNPASINPSSCAPS